MEALHDIVRAGKARYIGASSMYAWQFAKAQEVARAHGWTRFVSMQNHLNLLYREEEREMIPLCADQGVGLMPWSPLARGRLSRPRNQSSSRIESDISGRAMYAASQEADGWVIDAVEQVAKARGVPMAQIGLAWVLTRNGVSAPVVGASRAAHLNDAVAALEISLTPEEIAALEAAYVPHAVSGHK